MAHLEIVGEGRGEGKGGAEWEKERKKEFRNNGREGGREKEGGSEGRGRGRGGEGETFWGLFMLNEKSYFLQYVTPYSGGEKDFPRTP